jgi:hypothetical protein
MRVFQRDLRFAKAAGGFQRHGFMVLKRIVYFAQFLLTSGKITVAVGEEF